MSEIESRVPGNAHPSSIGVPWIPAFAGMTEGALAIGVFGAPPWTSGERRWIPAFAGMTEGVLAIGVSGAPPWASGERRWIPAFAGMTVEGVPASAERTILSASAGMTSPAQLPSFPPSRE